MILLKRGVLVLVLVCLSLNSAVARKRRMDEQRKHPESFLDGMLDWKSPRTETNTLEIERIQRRLRELESENSKVVESNEHLKEELQEILFGQQDIGRLIHPDLHKLLGGKLSPDMYLALFNDLAKGGTVFESRYDSIRDCLARAEESRTTLEKSLMEDAPKQDDLDIELDKVVDPTSRLSRAEESMKKLESELKAFTTYVDSKEFAQIERFLKSKLKYNWKHPDRSELAKDLVKKYLEEHTDYIVFPEDWEKDFSKLHLEKDTADVEAAVFSRFSDWYIHWRAAYWHDMESTFDIYREKISLLNGKIQKWVTAKLTSSNSLFGKVKLFWFEKTNKSKIEEQERLFKLIQDEKDFGECCDELQKLFNSVKLESEEAPKCKYN